MAASSTDTRFQKTTGGAGSVWRDGSLSQPSHVDIKQRLRQRFISAGLIESPSPESNPNPDIFFKGEGVSVCVVILDHALWADRRAIMDSIMRASASAGRANRTYLALPKSAASVTDARLFQERGIGLFTYDQRNVEEALPARYFETANVALNQGDKTASNQLENEIRELRAEFDMLQLAVRQLRGELASARKTIIPEEPVRAFTPGNPMPEMHVVENLPTFFAGNPWVEVLSRRGSEESTIAG